ncbi:transposase [Streptomyces flavotricini]|uniref:Transposase n=1 Tax=Streptomyces flavotricini TaxID=66888 RepID=A0ABS8E2K4_9ACTN|nr:zinc ribbon domain-containing protein [Streptomyces flavotricini]MCC0095283.1 transposase [Streptomyces flavotricini]
MKRAFESRFHPTSARAAQPLRTFGCVRKVHDLALAARAEASSVPLQQAWRHVQSAFVAFWRKRVQYPRFTSKRRSRASAEYGRSAFRCSAVRLTLAKTAQPRDTVWSRPLPQGVEPPTVLATVSTGEKVGNPRYERRDRERPARAQRALGRKEKGSRNRAEARTRAAGIHARIVAARYGRELITVDRWFPGTRLWSACGALAGAMPSGVREWTCEACGAVHDREGNAAVNLLTAGRAAAACGADVRPHRESFSRSGRSVVKREHPPARVGIPSLRGGEKPRERTYPPLAFPDSVS